MSYSQLGQDLWVLKKLNNKRNGFFVEFGACDGKMLSNTYLLEMDYGWNGILSEPAKHWHKQLKLYRSCKIDLRCVYDKSGDFVNFTESIKQNSLPSNEHPAVMSAVTDFQQEFWHSGGIVYDVETVSLNDLLEQNNAPQEIDYISIDVEGPEFKILSAFDFSKYKINLMSVEHMCRQEDMFNIRSLMAKNGFILDPQSPYYEDWYVNEKL